jgi:hypothetical protein
LIAHWTGETVTGGGMAVGRSVLAIKMAVKLVTIVLIFFAEKRAGSDCGVGIRNALLKLL